MARKVTKKIASAEVFAFNGDKEIKTDENGNMIPNFIFTMDGNPSDIQAYNYACKLANTKNLFIDHINVNVDSLDVSAETFYANSEVCDPNVSYGHDFITREFTIITCKVMYKDENGMHMEDVTYPDDTTFNKLLNYVREYTNCKTAIINGTPQKQIERRYMSVEKYKSLAK